MMPTRLKDPRIKDPTKGIKKKPVSPKKQIRTPSHGGKKMMGGGTMRKPMMAKRGKTVKIPAITPKKGIGKAGTGKKGVSLKAGFKKLKRGGKA
tara:strand:+ start:462 stop:743 length:282 start_codon:yes stop_codon:yes gene_type:complete